LIEDPAPLLQLPKLERLYLRETRISSSSFAGLLSLPRLRLLDLSGTPLQGLPEGLSSQVSSLNLAHTGLGPADAGVLARADLHLESLNLSGDPLGDAGVEALCGASWLSMLKALDLVEVNASVGALAHLKQVWGGREGLTL